MRSSPSTQISRSAVSPPKAPAFIRTAPPSVPGNADHELDAGEPGALRRLRHPLVERAGMGDHHRSLDLDAGERPAEPHDHPVKAAVPNEQVRGDTHRQHRQGRIERGKKGRQILGVGGLADDRRRARRPGAR